MPRSLTPGLAFSYVNRRAGQVHLRLHLPHFTGDSDAAGARLKLVNGSRSRIGPASIASGPDGAFLEATLPAGELRRGEWQIQISPKRGAGFAVTGARVLISDPNPISLLLGAAPASSVPAPVHTLPRRQRVAKSLGRVADRALVELPAQRAQSARRTLRRVARKVMPTKP